MNPRWIIAMSLVSMGCVTQVAPVAEVVGPREGLIVGRVLAAITGETGRKYEPAIRSLELEHQESHERVTIQIESDDRQFSIALSPGAYRLNRVHISEGPFMSMADVGVAFSVSREAATYVGTWRFGIDSPRYGRMLTLSMVMDQDDRSRADVFLSERYPTRPEIPVTAALPEPSAVEARLYEVMPYPRYPRYFRRHNW